MVEDNNDNDDNAGAWVYYKFTSEPRSAKKCNIDLIDAKGQLIL